MHKGFTLWFTGLSGAGKSTISERVFERLRDSGAKVELLDGDVDLVFNTTEGWQSLKDSHSIRTTTLHKRVPYFTTAAASLASARAIEAVRGHALEVASLQSYYSATAG